MSPASGTIREQQRSRSSYFAPLRLFWIVLCRWGQPDGNWVAYDLAFDQRMYEAWLKLLPGLTWLTWPGFLLGLVETFLYGIYVGLVFAPLYNLFGSAFSPR